VPPGEPLRTLIERWNGTKWTVVPSPTPGSGSNLNAAAVASADSVWAVGQLSENYVGRTLIERWNGTAWNQVSSPDVAGTNSYSWWAVAAAHSTAWRSGATSMNRHPSPRRYARADRQHMDAPANTE
jgi:hypothetical protein